MKSKDYYQVLEVPSEATEAELKEAYRRMVMRWHPDRHVGHVAKLDAEMRFKILQQAYQVLSSPELRRNYDATRPHARKRAAKPKAEPAAEAKRKRASRNVHKGADVEWKVAISLRQAIDGCILEYPTKKQCTCNACAGAGYLKRVCEACNGKGYKGYLWDKNAHQECPVCTGNTYVRHSCASCRGKGTVTENAALRVRVRPGITDGAELVVREAGKASLLGGTAGDLHIIVSIAADSGWVISGCDLQNVLAVPFSIALLGGEMVVELPSGKSVKVAIPPHSDSGRKIRLAKMGLHNSRTGTTGDVTLQVSIVLPKLRRKLGPEVEAIIRSLDQASAAEPQ